MRRVSLDLLAVVTNTNSHITSRSRQQQDCSKVLLASSLIHGVFLNTNYFLESTRRREVASLAQGGFVIQCVARNFSRNPCGLVSIISIGGINHGRHAYQGHHVFVDVKNHHDVQVMDFLAFFPHDVSPSHISLYRLVVSV